MNKLKQWFFRLLVLVMTILILFIAYVNHDAPVTYSIKDGHIVRKDADGVWRRTECKQPLKDATGQWHFKLCEEVVDVQ